VSNDIWIKIKHKQYPKGQGSKENIPCGAEFTIKADNLENRLHQGNIYCPNCGIPINDTLWTYNNVLKGLKSQQEYFDFSLISPSDKRTQQLVESLLKALNVGQKWQ